MPSNFKTVVNFRDGIQVDTDDIVSSNGFVGIGSTLPRETLDVRGNTVVDGTVTANAFNVSGFSTITSGLTVGLGYSVGIGTAIPEATFQVGVGTTGVTISNTGIVTAIRYFGDGGSLSNLPTSQWVDVDVGLGFTSIYAAGNVGIATTNPLSTLQIGQRIRVDGPSGVMTAFTFSGELDGTAAFATTATNAQGLQGTPNIEVGSIVGASASITGFVTATTSVSVGSSFQANAAGLVTATTFYGALEGTATQANVAAGTTNNPNIVVTSIASSAASLKPFYLFSSGISTFEGDVAVLDQVAIGTASPGGGYKLDVLGNARVQGTLSPTSVNVGGLTIASALISAGAINFTTGVSTFNSLKSNTIEATSQIKIGAAETPSQPLDVTGNAIVDGNVGVGTSIPLGRFDVATGTALVRQNLFIGTSVYDNSIEDTNSIYNDTVFPGPGAGSDGSLSANVGIGTTVARSAFDMGYSKRPLILPALTTTERNNLDAQYEVEGAIIYNSTTQTVQFYNGTIWGNI